MKGLQSTYMATLFGTFGAKNLASWQVFKFSKNENPNSNREIKLLFLIKYLKSNKRTFIIYFNEFLSLPLERILGNDLLT